MRLAFLAPTFALFSLLGLACGSDPVASSPECADDTECAADEVCDASGTCVPFEAGSGGASASATTAATTGTGGAGGGPELIGLPDVSAECQECAKTAVANECAAAMQACIVHDDCIVTAGCIGDCNGDPNCIQGCLSTGDGPLPYITGYMDCVVCNACPTECHAEVWCKFK